MFLAASGKDAKMLCCLRADLLSKDDMLSDTQSPTPTSRPQLDIQCSSAWKAKTVVAHMLQSITVVIIFINHY